MIRKSEPLSMAESIEYMNKDLQSSTLNFVKKFTQLKPKEGKELRKKLEDLDLIKMNEKHICKLIDLMPKNNEDLNKIFIDVGLDEDETKKILETIKEFE